MIPQQIFKSLEGKWGLQRTLDRYGIIKGTAIFSYGLSPDILFYREDFQVNNFNRNSMHSYKEYEYHHNRGKITKYFKQVGSTGSVFYELEFTEDNSAFAMHFCNQDKYKTQCASLI